MNIGETIEYEIWLTPDNEPGSSRVIVTFEDIQDVESWIKNSSGRLAGRLDVVRARTIRQNLEVSYG